MTIFDLRSTHGGGKSHLVHRLIEIAGESHSIMRDEELIGTYIPRWKVAALGTYIYNCGGCDQIKKPDEVCRRVRDFAVMDEVQHVILEGILVAHTFQRYANLSKEFDDYRFCFLQVPLDVCIARVEARRVKRGWAPKFDLKHITNDFKRVHLRLPGKFRDAGCTVLELAGEGDDGVQQLIAMLEGNNGTD